MSPELIGVLIGGAIGSLSSLIGIFISHWLEMKRDKYRMKLEADQEFRKRLTEGVSKGVEKLYRMNLIDEGKLPRSYAIDPKFIDDLLKEIDQENS